MVLMEAGGATRPHLDRNGRGGVQVVARPLVAHPWPTVAGAPEGQMRLRVVVCGHPYGSTTGLPLISLGPCLTSRLTRRGNRVRFPERLACLGRVSRPESSNAQLSA